MKLDFIGMSEHILRTPITIIRGHLHNLFNDETLVKLNEHELSALNKSINSVNELKDLVENLLSLSEISQGRLTLDVIRTSLEELIRTVVNEYENQAKEKGITVTYIPPLYEIPLVKVDIMKVLEVLRNIIGNAIKFTDQGSIDISIQKQEDGMVQVSVKDTGRGIPARNLPHIFSKFYRIKKPLEMDSSSGLGLFVSKKIIEAHGGDIWVESTENVGSTFHFTFPV